eukprot:1249897-Rhodomonas_salina.2
MVSPYFMTRTTCELLAFSRYWSLRVTALFTFALTALALSGYAYFNENGNFPGSATTLRTVKGGSVFTQLALLVDHGVGGDPPGSRTGVRTQVLVGLWATAEGLFASIQYYKGNAPTNDSTDQSKLKETDSGSEQLK